MKTDINEEQRQGLRERAAIAAMQGLISTMSNTEILMSISRKAQEDGLSTSKWIASMSAGYADALVEELYPHQKEKEQDEQKDAKVEETPIGGIFTLNGKQYVCKAADGRDCDQCALLDVKSGECLGDCSLCDGNYREDKTDIIYEQVTP